MGKPNQFSTSQFIAAIPGTGGIITSIARKVGCDWHTAKKYIEQHPTVKLAYDAEFEGVLDLTEAKLIEQINNSEGWAIKYMLSTKGKVRGYVERTETIIDLPQDSNFEKALKSAYGKPDDPNS